MIKYRTARPGIFLSCPGVHFIRPAHILTLDTSGCICHDFFEIPFRFRSISFNRIPSLSNLVPSLSNLVPLLFNLLPSLSNLVPLLFNLAPLLFNRIPSLSNLVPLLFDQVPLSLTGFHYCSTGFAIRLFVHIPADCKSTGTKKLLVRNAPSRSLRDFCSGLLRRTSSFIEIIP